MKILTFLKGETMDFQFNPAQLSRCQRNSLIDILGVIESENDQAISVRVIEFPLKFAVKLDDDIELLLGWDPETDSYAGLTTPESAANGVLKRAFDKVVAYREKMRPAGPDPIPESQKDTVDLPASEPDLSPVVVRVQALALSFASMIKPLNNNQRLEIGIEFYRVLFKELLK